MKTTQCREQWCSCRKGSHCRLTLSGSVLRTVTSWPRDTSAFMMAWNTSWWLNEGLGKIPNILAPSPWNPVHSRSTSTERVHFCAISVHARKQRNAKYRAVFWRLATNYSIAKQEVSDSRGSRICGLPSDDFTVSLCVTYRRVLDWMIGFIDTIYIQLVTKIIQRYRWSTHFTFHRYTRTSVLSSLVVSWQRIYNSLTVTSKLLFIV
jgi:hypothetical protein